ncbi:Zn-ribbon domain-containing OB-fold protein [Alkalihalobacterium elongatum]|uniref:Zn-ribbon domain-containing OB-fold protein n=1 Tax=Alkalihalobacterium elongatum TaxID=2675466 RepID=UPI001C1F251F|nr:OB-fold domain-containing protein [Alkalihalobacterium elongatum]
MKLPVKRCKHCQSILYTSKYHCTSCYSDELELTEIDSKGKIYSYTKIHAAPKQFADQTPYYIILVHLDQGLRVTGRFNGNQVEINTPVELEEIKDRAYFFKATTA